MRLLLHLATSWAVCSVRAERPASRSILQPANSLDVLSRGEDGEEGEEGTNLSGRVPRQDPVPGSQTWPLIQGDRCKARAAYECGEDHCCCRLGCIYDVEKDRCAACDDRDPLVTEFHIPSSHLWKERAQGLCEPEHSHVCGRSCCCNAEFRWNLETRQCEHTVVFAEAEEPEPEVPVPAEDPIPGSQTWGEHQCENRNAYVCNDGKHCCCRMGCTYDVEYDQCRGCSDSHPDVVAFHIPASQLWSSRREEHTCEPLHSHLCGQSCCCNAEWAWDLEQRQCVKAVALREQSSGPNPKAPLPPPKAAPIAGSSHWESCEAHAAYTCGDNHCCCMFGCDYDVEEDACTGCDANTTLVAEFHIPASHLWAERKQARCSDPYKCGHCDDPLSHRCGWSCCCNAEHVWDLELRRCVEYHANAQR